MKQPQKLPLDKIYDILSFDEKQNRKALSFHNGIGVAIGIDGFFFRHLGQLNTPYLLEDYRMGIVVRGTLRGIINLQEHTIREGTIVFVTPGTIVEPLGTSDDFLLEGLGVPADVFLMANGGKLPKLFNGRMGDGRKELPSTRISILDSMLRLLHALMEQEDTSLDVTYNIIAAIGHYYDQQFLDYSETLAPSHSKEIFNRFLRLVNLHGPREHQLSFYADKLCITSRYLGTLVMSVSGVSAKEWIDRSIISTAKVMLRHSDKQTAQIADELNFPNASFFCKYFKRITGRTPLQYRKGETA